MFGLSPLSTGHPLGFQPKWVRPSTGSYPRFSLPMDSSPGFASTAGDCKVAILKTRFRCGSFHNLTSPHTVTRWLILQKARRHSAWLLRLLVGARFQVLFHSPPGVLFTFPSRYWFAIGHRRVFSLGGWSPQVPTGFHVPGGTRVPATWGERFRVRGSHPLRPAFPCRSAPCSVYDIPPGSRPWDGQPATPTRKRPGACTRVGLGYARVRSPLLAGSRLISFPPGT